LKMGTIGRPESYVNTINNKLRKTQRSKDLNINIGRNSENFNQLM
jgi:hypothetical protein